MLTHPFTKFVKLYLIRRCGCPEVHESEHEQATVIAILLAGHIRHSAGHVLSVKAVRHARMLLEPAHGSGGAILLI